MTKINKFDSESNYYDVINASNVPRLTAINNIEVEDRLMSEPLTRLYKALVIDWAVDKAFAELLDSVKVIPENKEDIEAAEEKISTRLSEQVSAATTSTRNNVSTVGSTPFWQTPRTPTNPSMEPMTLETSDAPVDFHKTYQK